MSSGLVVGQWTGTSVCFERKYLNNYSIDEIDE